MLRHLLLGFIAAFATLISPTAHAQSAYVPPASPRFTYDFNSNWKFIREDVAGADSVDFDDSKWTNVSTPHTFNDVDSFRNIISHGGGDRGTWKGKVWYRKHFKLPADVTDRKVFLEFEGMRQAGEFYLNGKRIGLSENGVTAFGVDISDVVNLGGKDNLLAAKIDNRSDYAEQATRTSYSWNSNAFNPNYGGINRRVWLHTTGKIYQTLPIYESLKTTGVYIYPSNISVANHSADITVESQVHNASASPAKVDLSVVVVDRDGQPRAKFQGRSQDVPAGEKSVITATGPLTQARLWSVDDPYLYAAYSILTVDGKVVDVNKITTGFRKTDFKGGAGTGGVFINDKYTYLPGFAQRVSNEWQGFGQAYPVWMHDYTARMIRDCNSNYVRWMHVAPQRVDVEACDRAGIVEVCPAGDKEGDTTGRRWDQRVEVMRNTIIYFRNNPSILFWEAGNTVITPDHMTEMVACRKQWDPSGGRVMGSRGSSDNALNTASTPLAEYYGVMVGQDQRTDALQGPKDMFRAYSAERRDRAPLIETEDFREEAARRFWDDYSPPYFGFKKGPTDTWNLNSETHAVAAARRYWQYAMNEISNPDPAHSKWSGYASIYFTDANADGRQQSSEVCRVSGKVDAVRLPKQIYFVHRVMQNPKPDIHIIGHWNYPVDTTKTMYVIANHVDGVELFVNGKTKGKIENQPDGFIYAFDNTSFEPGSIKAVGYQAGKAVAEYEIKTAGEPKAIKLTSITGPDGLRADGGDAALFDVEVVDAAGLRCPTDDARIDFTIIGPAIWRGGYNSGKTNSTNNLYLNTECGINRVGIRSTTTPGKITLTAKREGLESATISVEAKPVEMKDGLALEWPKGGR